MSFLATAARRAADAASPASSAEDEWTLAGWIAATPAISATLAKALLKSRPAHQTELQFARTLAREGTSGSDRVLNLLNQGGALEALAEQMTTGLGRLSTVQASTGAELQGKFLQDGAGTLSYSGLSTFFRGLEGIVGAPEPKVHDAMEKEHTACGDSHDEFTTGNYKVTTSSAIEWAFVATPDQPPPNGWPIEQRLVQAGQDGKMRNPEPVAALQARTNEKNLRLKAMQEPELMMEEATAARLYTGPLFVKYNGVLRGLGSDVPSLRNVMVQLCCPKAAADEYKNGALRFEDAKKGLNTYTTTLHAINSSIVKLSKLTVTTKVYRGVSGMVLPKEFWEANVFGVKGGIEGAFMSTTTDRNVALSYAASASNGSGFVFEIPQGMVDRGADIFFLSQYPHEKEILFGPLTGLEVRSTRVDGTALVVEVALSINLASLTIEQVIGKRKKMLTDMLPNLEGELRQELDRQGMANAKGVEYLLGKLRGCDAVSKEPEWYTDDKRLKEALAGLLETRRELGSRGGAWTKALLALEAAEREELGYVGSAWRQEVIEAIGQQRSITSFSNEEEIEIGPPLSPPRRILLMRWCAWRRWRRWRRWARWGRQT